MKSLKKKLLTSSDPHKTILPDIYFDILSGIYSGIFSGQTFQQGRGGEDNSDEI